MLLTADGDANLSHGGFGSCHGVTRKRFDDDTLLSQHGANQLIAATAKAQLCSVASLPYGLGLEHAAYQELLRQLNHSVLFQLDEAWQVSSGPNKQRAAALAALVNLQLSERNELVTLLMSHLNPAVYHGELVAVIVATASLTPGHLWKSLGLASRAQLRQLLNYFFPQLVAKNDNNMRWKRFFYRCLCEQSGDYVCKAPNCVDCSSYRECFVAE
ncbi:nitrogen fixation protein NifQ [Neiella marina]|uniref:Nitrogen fixation protein NifQ n=1 Tax=Neiella holothuriorum TaxID=2870530 RepID=A0ABS7EHZ1_9GAMM|nr:nitrogen fixation protein NifQ [Neiella holothuriorum]MBW8191959.1 nitrogen fixation protein NifQ [Neiella holothuriorum]